MCVREGGLPVACVTQRVASEAAPALRRPASPPSAAAAESCKLGVGGWKVPGSAKSDQQGSFAGERLDGETDGRDTGAAMTEVYNEHGQVDTGEGLIPVPGFGFYPREAKERLDETTTVS